MLTPAMAIASVTVAINFIIDDVTTATGRRVPRGQ
jgi:hypothetical protein